MRYPRQNAGETAQSLGGYRVALVRHGGGAFLSWLEGLFDLGDLGPLEVAELGRDRLDRRAHSGTGVQIIAMAVPRDHLGGGDGFEAERLADVALDEGVDVRVRTDSARELADRDRFPGALEAGPVAVRLEAEKGQLGAKSRRLGMHAMGPPDGGHPGKLVRPTLKYRDEAVEGLKEQAGRSH